MQMGFFAEQGRNGSFGVYLGEYQPPLDLDVAACFKEGRFNRATDYDIAGSLHRHAGCHISRDYQCAFKCNVSRGEVDAFHFHRRFDDDTVGNQNRLAGCGRDKEVCVIGRKLSAGKIGGERKVPPWGSGDLFSLYICSRHALSGRYPPHQRVTRLDADDASQFPIIDDARFIVGVGAPILYFRYETDKLGRLTRNGRFADGNRFV